MIPLIESYYMTIFLIEYISGCSCAERVRDVFNQTEVYFCADSKTAILPHTLSYESDDNYELLKRRCNGVVRAVPKSAGGRLLERFIFTVCHGQVEIKRCEFTGCHESRLWEPEIHCNNRRWQSYRSASSILEHQSIVELHDSATNRWYSFYRFGSKWLRLPDGANPS